MILMLTQSSSYVAMYGKYDSKLLIIHQKHKWLGDHSVEEMDLEDHNDGIDSAQKSAREDPGKSVHNWNWYDIAWLGLD
jgi:hypothetical protein